MSNHFGSFDDSFDLRPVQEKIPTASEIADELIKKLDARERERQYQQREFQRKLEIYIKEKMENEHPEIEMNSPEYYDLCKKIINQLFNPEEKSKEEEKIFSKIIII